MHFRYSTDSGGLRVVFFVAVGATAAALAAPSLAEPAGVSSSVRPNVVLIVTDNQVEFGAVRWSGSGGV